MLVYKNNNIGNNKRLILLVFAFFLIVNITSSDGHYDPIDGIETFLVTEAMVLHHSAKLYPDSPSIKSLHFDLLHSGSFWQGLYFMHHTWNVYQWLTQPAYIWRSLLLSAIAIPFYYTALISSISPITLVALLTNPIILAFTSVIIFCFALKVYQSKKIAFILSLIFGVCSFAWSYNSGLLPQPLQGLCFITSAFFMYISTRTTSNITAGNTNSNNHKGIYLAGLAGLFLGLSVFAQAASIIMIPGFIVYSILLMRRSRIMENLIPFLIVLGVIFSFYGLVNYWRFGSFFETGYGGYVPSHNGLKGLVGLLISPGVGLIFYFPLVVLLPIALKDLFRENKPLAFIVIYVIIVTWLFFGTISYDVSLKVAYGDSVGWFGGEGWGPRYLVPTLPFLALALGALLTGSYRGIFRKISIITLSAIGFYVSLLGILVWWQYGLQYGYIKEELWRYDLVYNQTKLNSYAAMVWIPHHSPIVLHTKVLLTNFVSSEIQPDKLGVNWNLWGGLGLAPCAYNVYLFCTFGIIPILLLSGLIIAIAVLIIMEINNVTPRIFIANLKNYIKRTRVL